MKYIENTLTLIFVCVVLLIPGNGFSNSRIPGNKNDGPGMDSLVITPSCSLLNFELDFHDIPIVCLPCIVKKVMLS